MLRFTEDCNENIVEWLPIAEMQIFRLRFSLLTGADDTARQRPLQTCRGRGKPTTRAAFALAYVKI
jgi:hypothetical protein